MSDTQQGIASRLLIQEESALDAASVLPVLEMAGKTRFTYQPVLAGGVETANVYRHTAASSRELKHWQGSCETEYSHNLLVPLLFGLLFELVSQTTDSPQAGLTTYVFRPRRLAALKSCKLGLEYETAGPFYIFHGAVVDTLRISPVARNIAKVRFDWKAKRLEQIPSSRDYTHAELTQYGQFNFLTETVIGPCYDDGPVGLSCLVADGNQLLADENGVLILSEDGNSILIEEMVITTSRATGGNFKVTVNGSEVPATEGTVQFDQRKTPARYGRDGQPARFLSGPFAAAGEIAMHMEGDTIPGIVAAHSEAAIVVRGTFEDGKYLEVSWPRAKFASGTPEGFSRNNLVFRAPWAGLETEAVGGSNSEVKIVL